MVSHSAVSASFATELYTSLHALDRARVDIERELLNTFKQHMSLNHGSGKIRVLPFLTLSREPGSRAPTSHTPGSVSVHDAYLQCMFTSA